MGVFEAIKLALLAFVEASKDFKILVSTYQKYQDDKWREELHAISSKLNGPTTSLEKADAAKKLADLLSRL
jgi:hypothetical protein